jgi:hypothetical protein
VRSSYRADEQRHAVLEARPASPAAPSG